MEGPRIDIRLDPADPFPLLSAGDWTLEAAYRHAEEVDRWLGLDVEATERGLAPSRCGDDEYQTWRHVPVRSMQTPYVEIRWLLAQLEPTPGTKIVDLGAGYGRMAFVAGRHHPGVAFIGYELLEDRVDAGRRALTRFEYPQVVLECADLAGAGFRPSAADIYFMYDYGTRAHIAKTLDDLREIARTRPIVVVGRGRASRDAIERGEPWLSQVVAPEHHRGLSIYRTRARAPSVSATR